LSGHGHPPHAPELAGAGLDRGCGRGYKILDISFIYQRVYNMDGPGALCPAPDIEAA
jgi:hypothetical protein